MVYRKILCLTVLVFFLISVGSASGVEPTTFPTNRIAPKTKIIPDKRNSEAGILVEPNLAPKVAPKTKGTQSKGTSETGVLVEPTLTPKIIPKVKKK